MKVKVQEHTYRIYRTDANYDTRRVYMQATDIGHIGVFYDEDNFFYDNVRTGDVFMFNGIEGDGVLSTLKGVSALSVLIWTKLSTSPVLMRTIMH